LRDNADFLRDGLRELGYDTGRSQTPIVPVILNDERTAALMAGRLREMGVVVSPILFPAVPLGSARLRLCATAAHSIEDLEFALNAFREIR
jgi:glycine C-acetyltransferase